MENLRFTVAPPRRMILLALLFVAGFCIAGVLAGILATLGGETRALAFTRIATVLQDIFMLVLPAVVTALIVTRRPATLLGVDRSPGLWPVALTIATMLVASPMMDVIIAWNAHLTLPESLAGVERSLRAAEQSAARAVETILGPHSAGNLAVSLLIVGMLAGFSEELFFRGAMQRILNSAPMSGAAAVWITAAIFSLVHFQAFGFVPRLLLGAYFGYLMLWSGSVWLPIVAHVVNNSLYVILRYTTGSGELDIAGASMPWLAVASSVVLTGAGLWLIRSHFKTANAQP